MNNKMINFIGFISPLLLVTLLLLGVNAFKEHRCNKLGEQLKKRVTYSVSSNCMVEHNGLWIPMRQD